MARHSKWHNIKHRKAAQDAKKWKIYSLHSKIITLLAQNGWDPDKNPSLYAAIAKAKSEGVPNENIDRAIKKWTWEDKSWTILQEIVYEWYWPSWVAIIVKTITDNKNRTASEIRHIFSKFWWNLWESWSVSWIFKRKWIIILDSSKYNYDEVEEIVFETNAEDIAIDEDIIKITTSPDDLTEIIEFLKSKNIGLETYEISYIPDNDIEVNDFDNALKLVKMLEAFEENDDVETVSSNENIKQELINKVEKFIEENTFRT